MKKEFQTQRHTVDLCVVGGGLAGLCAAVAAARGGSKVALIHDRPVLGGNASSEIRMWVCGAAGENNRETGIIEEIELRSLYRNPDKNYSVWDSILYETARFEPNITLLLNCSVFDAETDGSMIKSVTGWQTTTQKFHTVSAKCFADCSGDSVLAPLTGAAYRAGREAAAEFGEKTSQKESDARTMGMSCLLQMRKTDRKSKFIPPEWAKKLTEEELRLRNPHMDSSGENFWYLELGGNRDTVGDTEDIRDELLSLAWGMVDHVKNSGSVPDADYWELDWLGFLPGKRESRRMVGAYIMTQNDVLAGGDFPDTVAYGGWALDDHHPDGFYHAGNPNVWGETPSPYGIPYRCLYSANVGNLFFAGRNISVTHAAMSSTRVMATCALLGQAVGEAANLARGNGLSPAGVYEKKIGELQQRLIENGCFLPRFRRTVSPVCKKARLVCEEEAPANIDDLKNGVERNHRLYGEKDFRVSLPLGKRVSYVFAEPVTLENVHIRFDADLGRDTLPGDEIERKHTMRANRTPGSPSTHLPETLVKSYSLSAETASGERIVFFETDCNLRGCVNHAAPEVPLRSVSLTVFGTWGGDGDHACVFSFDVR
ncbi:MAG: FAD-dependent oxidoreductase [Clostridia bacterium]|nr:FAD-dependent oxidoreductase [Clostridia bacterium]